MSWLIQFGVVLYIICVSAIGLIALIVAAFGFYVGVNTLIDRYQGYKRRKPMATPMEIDELKMRRLARSVRQRIQTRKIANGR